MTKKPQDSLKPGIGNGLSERLGKNELRDYLENKEETGNLGALAPQKYVNYRQPMAHKPRVALVAPAITIPVGMAKRCIPPLGLSYIAAYLEKKQYEVSLYDSAVEGHHREEINGGLVTYGTPPAEAAEILLKRNPDVIGVSVLFSTDIENLFRLTREIKKRDPKVTVVVGGLHPTIYPKQIWEQTRSNNEHPVAAVDFIIRGEGEERFVEFLQDLEQGRINIAADGLVGEVGGAYFANHQFESIQNLDAIPFPAYHLLDMEKYFRINIPFSPVPQGNRVMQVLTTRGCPIGCTFCASTNMYKKYRMRSIENVLAEIEYHKKTYQVDELQFADDNIFLNKKRSNELFKKMIPLEVPWCTPNGVMVNTISEDLLELLQKSGLYQITLSLDSGSAKTLKNLHHKPVNLNSVPGLVNKCNELGIFSHGTLVVGMPGESLQDIQEGFDYVRDLGLTSLSTFIAAAIPGSELYHQAIEQGLIQKQTANRIDTTKSSIQLSEVPKEILEAKVYQFQSEFSESVKIKNPKMWKKKYAKLEKRDKQFDKKHGGRLT